MWWFCSFSVDGVPIRVFKNNEARGVPYPKLQPMGIYSTLWEADDWATRGGLEKIDWSKAPFNAYYTDFDIEGCKVPGPADCASNPNNWWEGAAYKELSPEEARRYRWVRVNHMIYDYCTDKARYPVPPPECYAGIWSLLCRTNRLWIDSLHKMLIMLCEKSRGWEGNLHCNMRRCFVKIYNIISL